MLLACFFFCLLNVAFLYLPLLTTIYTRSPQIFRKCLSNLLVADAKGVTLSESYTGGLTDGRRHYTKFSRPGDVAPVICAPLFEYYVSVKDGYFCVCVILRNASIIVNESLTLFHCTTNINSLFWKLLPVVIVTPSVRIHHLCFRTSNIWSTFFLFRWVYRVCSDWATGWRSGIRVSVETRNFSLLHNVKLALGPIQRPINCVLSFFWGGGGWGSIPFVKLTTQVVPRLTL